MKSNDQLRIASYNVRKCIGLDRRRRPGRIVDVLNDLDADIIALQEADRRLGERPAALPAGLIETDTDYRFVELPTAGPSVGWHGNAVLIKTGLETSRVDLLELPGTEPRGAVALEFADGFRFLATHLGLLRRDRRMQLSEICNFLGQSDNPTVLAGDFNEWSDSRGMEPLGKHYKIHSPGKSFHSARPVAALDRIATDDRVQIRDAGVLENRLSRIASDHLPIWSDISFDTLKRRNCS